MKNLQLLYHALIAVFLPTLLLLNAEHLLAPSNKSRSTMHSKAPSLRIHVSRRLRFREDWSFCEVLFYTIVLA